MTPFHLSGTAPFRVRTRRHLKALLGKDAVSHPCQKVLQGPSRNDVVSSTTNDTVSKVQPPFPPHMQYDAVSSRTLEGARKKLDPEPKPVKEPDLVPYPAFDSELRSDP